LTGGMFFGLVVVPVSILILGFICYYITGKLEEKNDTSQPARKKTN
jgi:hypothetical protein